MAGGIGDACTDSNRETQCGGNMNGTDSYFMEIELSCTNPALYSRQQHEMDSASLVAGLIPCQAGYTSKELTPRGYLELGSLRYSSHAPVDCTRPDQTMYRDPLAHSRLDTRGLARTKTRFPDLVKYSSRKGMSQE